MYRNVDQGLHLGELEANGDSAVRSTFQTPDWTDDVLWQILHGLVQSLLALFSTAVGLVRLCEVVQKVLLVCILDTRLGAHVLDLGFGSETLRGREHRPEFLRGLILVTGCSWLEQMRSNPLECCADIPL